MNIFTRFLAQFSPDEDLNKLIELWDEVEALIIGIYRKGEATATEEAAFVGVRERFAAPYKRWTTHLRPFWQNSTVGGTLDHGDPFAFIMNQAEASSFVDNWMAMQHLPAAREALNGLLVARSTEE